MKTVSFNKRLCSICLQSFSPLRLKKAGQLLICPACLKLIIEREDEWRQIARTSQPLAPAATTPPDSTVNPEATPPVDVPDTYTHPTEVNLVSHLSQRGEALLDEAKVIGKTFTPALFTLIVGRASIYLGGNFYLNPEGPAYAFLNGVMMADLITWIVFNILQAPFVGVKFFTEFAVYGGVVAVLNQTHHLLGPTPQGDEGWVIMAFTCFSAGIIKTFFWVMKTFAPAD